MSSAASQASVLTRSQTTGSARQAFVALLERDIRVVGKNIPAFLLRTVMQPLLFTFVFAYVFPKTGLGIGGARTGSAPAFTTVLVPGLVAVGLIFQGIQAVALPLTQEFSVTREIEDRVLAPLPIWAVGVGKIAAGAVQSLLAALVVFPIVLLIHAKGQAPSIHVANWFMLAFVLVLASVLASSFGLLVGTSVEPRQVPLLFSVLVLPMTLLGCIYYPWSFLHTIPWLKWAVLVNPLVYMSEALRATLTPSVHHMPPLAFYGAMIGATMLFMFTSLRAFRARVVA